MNRHFVNVLCETLGETAAFYERLLGMTRHYDMDWFILLTHGDMPGLEFGLLKRDHATVPVEARAAPAGVMATFVVDDVDRIHARAVGMWAPVVAPPMDMPYGQKRLLLRDPEGMLVDISSPTP